MSDLSYFRRSECPRCGSTQFHRLGESHYTVTPLMEQTAGKVQAAPDFTCYVKVCRNCAYVELYSKFLVDEFQATEEAIGKFGVITRTPGGAYLVSIFREYEHRGVKAKDFTVPIEPDQWFELSLVVRDMTDEQIVRAVLHGPYLDAWRERVGDVPRDLGRNLKTLISQYLNVQNDAG